MRWCSSYVFCCDAGELGNNAKLCFEGALGREETKEEMLIRTGEMTPFGTAAAPHTGRSVLPSTSAGAKLVRQVAPPRKRKKKEKLGTVVRRGIPRARTSCNSLLDEEFLLDPEVSDSEDAGQSDDDDEYRPEEEYLASDDDDDDSCKPLPVVKGNVSILMFTYLFISVLLNSLRPYIEEWVSFNAHKSSNMFSCWQ